MVEGVINKKELKRLITAVGKDGKFYGPMVGREGFSLSELGADDEMVFGYANLKMPGKRQFFPQSEVICTYDKEGMTEVPLSQEKVVIFGIRPCDVLSIFYIDKVFFDKKVIDPYYGRKRDNSIIISLACNDPLETCFCTSVGGSPAGKDGADILAFDLKDSLLFEACSEKGKKFMKDYFSAFKEPGQADLKARDKQVSEAKKKISDVSISGLTEKLQKNFDSPVWEKIAQRCLGCGICTYLCPTCHCFGIYDEKFDLKGRRIRVQDSCMFPLFTLEASGHNPRTSKKERMRQRIMHKFRYTVENFGDIFCVGCGRCISNCPVNMDIRETIAEVVK